MPFFDVLTPDTLLLSHGFYRFLTVYQLSAGILPLVYWQIRSLLKRDDFDGGLVAE